MAAGAIGSSLAQDASGPNAAAAQRAVNLATGQSPLIWGNLIHLSFDMWSDRQSDWPGVPTSQELCCRPYLRFDEKLWKELTNRMREGMDIALVSLTLQTGDEERDAANVEIFSKLTNACHALGIPVIGEYFPKGHPNLSPEQLHEDVLMGSRVVSELGADAIKTFYTHDFRAVTAACPVPVFGLGAEKLPTQKEALALAEREVEAGAGGVVFGRNAIQVPNPAAFQMALCDVVKHGKTAAEACREHQLES